MSHLAADKPSQLSVPPTPHPDILCERLLTSLNGQENSTTEESSVLRKEVRPETGLFEKGTIVVFNMFLVKLP